MEFLSKLYVQAIRIWGWDKDKTESLSEDEFVSEMEKVESVVELSNKLKTETEAVAKLTLDVETMKTSISEKEKEVGTLTESNHNLTEKVKEMETKQEADMKSIVSKHESDMKAMKDEINTLKLGSGTGDPGSGKPIITGNGSPKEARVIDWNLPRVTRIN